MTQFLIINMKQFFFLIFLLLVRIVVFSQPLAKDTNKMLVGVIDPNLSFCSSNIVRGYAATPLFLKKDGHWVEASDVANLSRLSIATGHDGKQLNRFAVTRLYCDSSLNRPKQYKVLKTNFRKVGNKNSDFVSMIASAPNYRPLVFNTRRLFKQCNKMIPASSGEFEEIIRQYILDTCRSYQLRIPDSLNLFEGKSNCFRNSSGDVIFFGNLNIDIYAFIARRAYTDTEAGELNIERRSFHDHQLSPDCCFTIKDGKVYLIGFGLNLLDYGDYDGDGVDEYILKKYKYNGDGYMLLQGDLKTSLLVIWSYH
jgi:hypothetical protein